MPFIASFFYLSNFQDNLGEPSDKPVIKLFEFLVSSLCLFMVEEEFDEEKRGLDLFMLGAPAGVRGQVR